MIAGLLQLEWRKSFIWPTLTGTSGASTLRRLESEFRPLI